jgi:hypothetical protein
MLKIIIFLLALTTALGSIQMVPDRQVLLYTNSLTTITGVTNLNDLILWIDANLAGKTNNWNYAYSYVTTNTIYSDATNFAYTTWSGRVAQIEARTNDWNAAASNSPISTNSIAQLQSQTNIWNMASNVVVGLSTNLSLNVFTGTVQFTSGSLTNVVP